MAVGQGLGERDGIAEVFFFGGGAIAGLADEFRMLDEFFVLSGLAFVESLVHHVA